MIYDVLPRSGLYRNVHARFAIALDWLARFDPAAPDGRVDLDGDHVFALVQSYTTGPAGERKFETHRDRIDIQYVAQGVELMQVAPAAGLTVTEPYDPAKDVAFYANPPEFTSVVCTPGAFTVFFPSDAHKPTCAFAAPAAVKKVVIKIRV